MSRIINNINKAAAITSTSTSWRSRRTFSHKCRYL